MVNYEFSFASIDWSVVIFDEAQEIKETSSHKSTVAKALKADFRIACTGTPVENSLMDLWNIFDFLQPLLLGTKSEFKSICNKLSGDEDNDSNQVYQDIRNKLHYGKPYAYILRREKKDVLGDLPVKTIIKLVLEHEFNIDNIDIINGEAKNRQALIDKFQKDDNTFKILILSPRAAGVGLNIVKANHVIHYGRWWNPAKENQATDRVYRIGQEKDVHVYYLIDVYPDRSEYTFDEKLHNLIMKKIELAHNFLLPNDIEIDKEMFIDSFK